MKMTAVFTPIVEILLIATVFVRTSVSAELKTVITQKSHNNVIPLQHSTSTISTGIKGV